MNDNVLYLAVVLDGDSSTVLNKIGKQYIKNVDGFEPKFFCHHMTIAFRTNMPDNIVNYVIENEGNHVSMMVTHIGLSDKAIAAKVKTAVPSTNENKHITIAINTLNGGKPVDSNKIVNWIEVNNFVVNGTIKIIYKQ